MDVGESVQRSPWGLAVVALLGLSGCLPAGRGWVEEQLAPVQLQVAEMRDRVAVVEGQLERIDPKVDRILTQMDQRRQQSIGSDQHPAAAGFTVELPFLGQLPGNLAVETSLDFMIAGGATPLGGGTIPADELTAGMPAEARQRREPRRLTEDEREQFLRTLREDPKVPLTVVAISGDNESYAFARKLDMLFSIAGWPTRGVGQQPASGVPPGLTLVSKSGDATISARAAHLQDTLHAMGIAAQRSTAESIPEGILMLVVGPKPP
jgi:hypothetical protein